MLLRVVGVVWCVLCYVDVCALLMLSVLLSYYLLLLVASMACCCVSLIFGVGALIGCGPLLLLVLFVVCGCVC